jgi:hypothetical protein
MAVCCRGLVHGGDEIGAFVVGPCQRVIVALEPFGISGLGQRTQMTSSGLGGDQVEA